ncbi:hypothetical protein VSS74_08185 [Conexibacter stalactiti]|uniref:Uncharacterized protein n=1 Tax=Conexibacter stalactiti TaxID=1940611 RepID=A0ABU4HLX6_9ACTN|nr:hypothetical protein [Conexibacter stalactiti]MDW5594310.1 hypothetical protein [Conexibacter stalactiti]MEC5034952.1 hypothetical protein [Conexibacter stalactiti]
MSAPLAHLYALALRALDAHDRRAHELRARLAPVLAAGAAGLALLAGPAASAVARGGPACGVALIVTVCGAVVTVVAVGRLLSGERSPNALTLADAQRLLHEGDGMTSDARFYEAMIRGMRRLEQRSEREYDRLSRLFTGVMCGILFVLCGLALTALVG